MKINVVTLCSGYGSQEMALKRLRCNYPHFDFDIIATSEIDANAITAYNACHPEFEDRQVGDLTTYDWSNIKESIDCLFYSTPCQSVSRAGKRKGMKEGDDAASALIWHTRRVIETLKPRILILENVRGMIDKKNIKDFNDWQHTLEQLGYTNFTQVLNSKDFGVAQSRERIFMVSILNCDKPFYFPKPFPLTKRLKDYLEDEVDEKYYLSDEQVKRIIAHCERKISEGCGFNYRFEGENGISGTVCAAYGTRPTDTYLKEPRIIQVGNLYPDKEDGFSNPQCGRVYDAGGDAPCINTCGGGQREPKIFQRAHGYNGGGLLDGECSPSITISSWQNNNYLAEPKVIQKVGDRGTNNYSVKDISNTIPANPMSDRWQHLVEQIGVSVHPLSHALEFNGKIGEEISPCLRATDYKAPHCVWEQQTITARRTEEGREIRRQGIDVFANKEFVPREDGVSGTITIVQKDNYLAGPCEVINVGRIDYAEHSRPHQQDLVQHEIGICRTIPAGTHGSTPHLLKTMVSEPKIIQEATRYRIRKLTPRECFRLMDVDDSDIDKIQATGISKTAQYKLAGNSIVVSCLYYIFKSLFIDTEPTENQQLTLF